MAIAQMSPDTLEQLAMNVFMLLSEFDPSIFDFETGIDGSKIIGSTTGGVNFKDTPTYTDMGSDIDNCKVNCVELKRKDDGEVSIGGNLVTVNKNMVKDLIGAATISGNKITPDLDLKQSHFRDKLWGLTDWGNGGLMAIEMKRVLNTSGFQVATTNKNKSQFAFNYVCHNTIKNPKDTPYNVYLLTPDDNSGGVLINTHAVTVEVGDTVTLSAETVPSGKTVTWTSASTSVAEVTSGGVVSGVAAGNTVITASITVEGVTYTDTCTVIVKAASNVSNA